MRFEPIDPPRKFRVGSEEEITLSDFGRVALEPDEQVTFTTPGGGEVDVTRKDWGFYAAPSLNSRLPRYGLRPVLVRNRDDHVFLLLVEQGHESLFDEYVSSERLSIIAWLDRDPLGELGAV